VDDQIRDITIGGTHGSTLLEPATMLMMGLMIGMLLFLRRGRAILPMLMVIALIPAAQRVVIASLDFNMVRLMIVAGWIRILARGEHKHLRQFNEIDRALLMWTISSLIFYTIGHARVSDFVYRLGTSIDMLGGYFMYRCFVRSRADIDFVLRCLAVITPLLGFLLWYEFTEGSNLFHVFGANESVYVSEHTDRVRAVGPFSHPILSGCFAAGMMPFMIYLFSAERKRRPYYAISMVGTLLLVIAANTSGGLMGFAGGIGAWCLWVLRRQITFIWVGGAVLLLVLHILLEKPIWHLYVRLANVTGGTGFHRYKLVDACVERFTEWALFGTKSTAHWGWGLQDITNQWVFEAVNGGLVTLMLFNYLLFVSFRSVGRALRMARGRKRRGLTRADSRHLELMGWGIGSVLVANCTAFLGVSYFGQMNAVWYLVIAMVASYAGLPVFSARKSAALTVEDSAVTAVTRRGPRAAIADRPSDGHRAPHSEEATEKPGTKRPSAIASLLYESSREPR